MKIVYFLPDVRNPFWKEVAAGVEQSLPAPGDSLKLVSCDHDARRQLAQLQDHVPLAPDAVLLSPVEEDGVVPVCRAILDSRLPLVAIDSNMTSHGIASVISGNMRGGMLAASHIADRAGGAARVVHVKAEEHLHNVKLRSSSFAAEARRRGLRIVETIQADSSREVARARVAAFLARGAPFEAVFAENDSMAIGAVEALEAARRSPHPVVVGYDGTAEAQELVRSRRLDATVFQDAPLLGRKAVELVVSLLQGKPAGEAVTVLPRLLTSAELT